MKKANFTTPFRRFAFLFTLAMGLFGSQFAVAQNFIPIQTPGIAVGELGPNLLINPSFEDGPTGPAYADPNAVGAAGWDFFGAGFPNAFIETTGTDINGNTGAIFNLFPSEGNQFIKQFGNFVGPFGVTGFAQNVPAVAGTTYKAAIDIATPINDGISGGDNFYEFHIEFKDADNNILVNTALNTFIYSSTAPFNGGQAAVGDATGYQRFVTIAEAPAGTVSATVSSLFFNVNWNGGALYLDNASYQEVIPQADLAVEVCPNETAGNVTIPVSEAAAFSGIASFTNDFNGTDDASGAYPLGTTTVNYTATANSGDVAMHSFDVTVSQFVIQNGAVISCNDNVQISLPMETVGGASITVTPDMILEGAAPNCDDNLFINVDNTGTNLISCANVGETVTVMVTDIETNNSCWGSITVEDKLGPELVCPNGPQVIACYQNPDNIAAPMAIDNCTPSSQVDVNMIDELISTVNQCVPSNIAGMDNSGTVTITRTFTAFDEHGNESATPCVQTIILTRPTAVDFPADVAWYCADYAAHSNLTDATALTCSGLTANANLGGSLDGTNLGVATQSNTACLNTSGSGIPDVISNGDANGYCNFAATSSDDTLATCGNIELVFKIVRTWTVIDWCDGGIVTFNDANNNGVQDADEEDNIQIIKVIDDRGPVVTNDAITVSANQPGQHPQPCLSTAFIPNPAVIDDCNEFDVRIFTPVGEVNYNLQGTGGNIPAPGLNITGPAWFNAAGQPYPAAGATIAFDKDNANHVATHTPHVIDYQVTDACGNVSPLSVNLFVIDNLAPTAVCDEITDANLSSDGFATVHATTFDDGSNDNCCIDQMLVRKMDADACGLGQHLTFSEEVTFCCAEVGSSVMVVFRVFDCFGNFNDCMVSVNVSDKLPPYKVQDVADFNINCDVYYNNLEVALDLASADGNNDPAILNTLYGRPVYADNCDTIVDHIFAVNINSCGEGTITRTWTVEDGATPANVGPTCQQLIIVSHVNNWEVAFPDDVTLECTEGMNPGEDEDLFGEPTVFFDDCELIAVAQEDQIFNIVPDACYKIIRTHTAINWCVYDGADEEVNNASTTAATTAADNTFVSARRFRDGTNGIIVYQQVIKVLDNIAPALTCPDALDDVPVNANCVATINLPFETATDCSPDITVTVTTPGIGANGTVGIGYGPFNNVAIGTYTTTYTATDNCGNSESCEMTFSVVDNKPPTPYCVGGLVVELMPVDANGDGVIEEGMVDIWASDFDAGSFDNCPGAVKLTVWLNADNYASSQTLGYEDALNLNGSLPISCNSPFNWNYGSNDVYMYVTDASGNVDFCITTLIIESNPNIPGCPSDNPVVAGAIEDTNGVPVNEVTVDVNGGLATVTTTENGLFNFALPVNGDYTVAPAKDMNPLNGVTTYDLVLINQHILGTNPLDTPYKKIAADANNSGSVTAFDLVELRRLILLINSELPNNTSWKFVDANATFASNWTLADGFPQTISYNNLSEDQTANFIGVKVGDVNGSAIANNLTGSTEERTTGSVIFSTEDRALVAGQTYTVEFTAEEVLGYQFTLNFDAAAVEFAGIVEGQAKEANFGMAMLNEGAITASWNTAKAEAATFAVQFTATTNAQLSEVISMNSRYTAAEAYTTTGETMNAELNFNNTAAANNFALYQNTPNPFRGATNIGFNLAEAGNATLTVMDVAGKVLSTVSGDYAKGYNQVTVSNINATGVLYYTLETAGQTATRKMVIMD